MSKELYHSIGQQLADELGTTSGQMFGKPCLKTNKKAFAAFYKADMVFKLGQQDIAAVIVKYPGSNNWDPSGKNRPMKDWLQIPTDYSRDWLALSKQALDYVEEHK